MNLCSGVFQGFETPFLIEMTLMTSEAKIAACRINGKKSRGPKTPEGANGLP